MSNINKVRRQPQIITLSDGIERELKLTLNSFALLEERYGSIEAGMDAVAKGSIKAIRFMIWAGLIDSDPDITEIKVGSLIEIADLPEISNRLSAIMAIDMPDPEPETESKVEDASADSN